MSTDHDPGGPIGEPREAISVEAGRYLLGVYRLSAGRDGRVRTGELGAHLGVSDGAASEMAAKLARRRLLDREKHRGVRLTARSRAIAAALAWRHCVVAGFFRSVRDEDADEVDERIYPVAHRLPGDAVETLRERLGHPCSGSCPGTPEEYPGCQVEADP